MAINVTAAKNQANQIVDNVSHLRQARTQLVNYKNCLNQYWQAKEVPYMVKSIDQVISQIDGIIRDIESVGRDIKSTADTIKREEEAAAAAAAAARARAEKQKRIQNAQYAYNKAYNEFRAISEKKENLEKQIKKASFFEKIKLLQELEQVEKDFEKAEKKKNSCYSALVAAKR